VLTTYEGVLPGLRVETLLTADISAWVQWLRDRGATIPPRLTICISRKPTRSSSRTAARPRQPLRLPSHLHDTFFMTDQVIEYVDRQG
jgi:hypothetical protein